MYSMRITQKWMVPLKIIVAKIEFTLSVIIFTHIKTNIQEIDNASLTEYCWFKIRTYVLHQKQMFYKS